MDTTGSKYFKKGIIKIYIEITMTYFNVEIDYLSRFIAWNFMNNLVDLLRVSLAFKFLLEQKCVW
jgi:hypothetical protein